MSNFESKYANVLTIILVVVIIAIIVLLGIFGYNVYKSKKVDDSAQLAIEEFDKKINNNKKANTTNTATNTVTNTNIDDILNQFGSDDEQSDDNNSSSSSNTSTKTYLSGYEVIGKINIPKTGINLPILDRVTPDSLAASVAKLYGVDLNDPGNVTILGHNYRNGKFFSNNYKLSNGDKIIITDSTGTAITYIIYDMYETVPSDADYMLRDTEGYREISLSTCNDDSSLRLVILAREQA